MQMSIPGGIDYGDTQYREPLAGFDWRAKTQPVTVVNPFVELLQTNLDPAEMELLIPLLEGTDYVLAFDRQRFLPQRPQSLHRLQWVAGTLFEAAAQEDLIDPARLRGDKAERDAQIAELRAWCKRNAGVTTAARLATRLDKENDFAKWRELFWSLNRVDAVAAADAAVRLARRQPERVARVAQLLVLLDRREHVGDDRVWLAEDDAELRLWAALLVVAAKSDKDGASIGIALAHLATAPTATVHAAVPALFASERPEARSFLVECLKGKRAGFEPSFAFAGELLRRGVPEAFDVLDAALAKPAECTLREFGEPVREPGRGAVLVARWFPVEDGAREETPEDEAKFAAQVREQLRKEWDTIRAGEPPTMQVGGLELDWGDWVDRRGSGWVRRF
jgi:hypothetical protein